MTRRDSLFAIAATLTAALLNKHKHRLMLADYKDAKGAGLQKDFLPNICDLGEKIYG